MSEWDKDNLPACIRKFAELRCLELHRCSNLDLPVWFRELSTLQVLKLSDLDMKELPLSIGKLSELPSLQVTTSSLVMLSPSILATCPNLTSLTIYSPNLRHEIPASIFENLTTLTSLTLKSFQLGRDEKACALRGPLDCQGPA